MNASAYVVAALAGVLVLVAFVWRISSRRRSLPCPVWLGWLLELENPLTRTNRATVITGHLDLRAGMTVLDAGCGPGRLVVPIARQIGDTGAVFAVDIQPGMLERARKVARDAKIGNVHFVRAGLGDGKLGRGRFDRALLVTVLGEVPDREAALREIFDALKPGGILSVTETMFDPHYQRRETVMRLAEAVGFRETNFFGNRVAFTLNLEKPEAGNRISSRSSQALNLDLTPGAGCG